MTKESKEQNTDITEENSSTMSETNVAERRVIEELNFVPIAIPILLEVASDIWENIDETTEEGHHFRHELIPLMRQGLFYQIGVQFPEVRFRLNENFPAGHFSLSLHDTPVVRRKTFLDHIFVSETPQRFSSYRIPAKAARHPLTRRLASWIPKKDEETVKTLGLPHWSALEYLILEMSVALEVYAGEFLGIQEVKKMLDSISPAFPDLVAEALNLMTLPAIRRVLRLLVKEQFSIHNLRQILELLVDAADEGLVQTEELVDAVRQGMKRYLSHKASFDEHQLIVYLVDSELEDHLRHHFHGVSLPKDLSPYPRGNDLLYDLLFLLRDKFSHLPPSASAPVVLTHSSLRRPLQNLFRIEFPEVTVLAFSEVDPLFQVQIVDTIPLPQPMFS